ncbi:hypothetical protein [Rathayibacter tanaceti]|uniref:Transposase Helix-turn-helix domain-containing protein n=1 Tax=Rathayibacter tanaceti TaxID=1671680 RepID=A0AAE6V897_9MICO|nr:hypothetical protein [Rathayibacter tanaceti]QHC56706.1 hypothetical protein GSU10_14445 [Rathayibacter tanaceti]
MALFRSVAVTLACLRCNSVQPQLAEMVGVSQPTISRTIAAFVPLVTATLVDCMPTVDDLDPNGQYIVDGRLFPCWARRDRPELYSGKNKCTGMNYTSPAPSMATVSGFPTQLPGGVRDVKALRESGFLDDPAEEPRHFGDRG